jgi:hypothetical protein
VSDIPQFLLALWTHWWAFMSGGLFAIDRLIDRYWLPGRDWLNRQIPPARRQRVEIVVFVFGALLAGFLAWEDEHQKVIAKTPLDPTILYQDSVPVASVRQPTSDATQNTISFPVITASRQLDMAKIFEFRDWKVLCSGTEGGAMTFGAMLQINYVNVVCRVQGNR